EKQSQILRADAAKQAKILDAEGQKEKQILEATGEAAAILKVQQALADSVRMLNEAAPSDQVIKIRALEAFAKAADGKATKIIIPSEIQGLAGLAASLKEMVIDDKAEVGKREN
ncbi:MAG: peptidase, partial [Clostridia bacterium]